MCKISLRNIFINHALGYFEPFRSFLFHNQVTPYWVETLLGGYYEPCFFPHAQMRCFFFRMTISQRSRCVFRWMAQLYDRGVISRWEQRGSIAWFWPMACYRILRPYGRKYPPNIIDICDIYIYLSIYISFGYVYVMFECLARCTCKFTQPHTCITSFHRLRNKQMNEWMNERKNEYTRTHYVYIYRSIYIKIYRLYVGC